MLGWDFWHEETLLTLVSLRSPQVRKFRTLTELIMDAEEHVKNPYKGKKLKVKPRGGNGGGSKRGTDPGWGSRGSHAGLAWRRARVPRQLRGRGPWARAKFGAGWMWPDAAPGACVRV